MVRIAELELPESAPGWSSEMRTCSRLLSSLTTVFRSFMCAVRSAHQSEQTLVNALEPMLHQNSPLAPSTMAM